MGRSKGTGAGAKKDVVHPEEEIVDCRTMEKAGSSRSLPTRPVGVFSDRGVNHAFHGVNAP